MVCTINIEANRVQIKLRYGAYDVEVRFVQSILRQIGYRLYLGMVHTMLKHGLYNQY